MLSGFLEAATSILFLARNSLLRLAFLFTVEGLALFFLVIGTGVVPPPDSMEKEKALPMVRESLKTLPCLSSDWQRARHWMAREESFPTAAIFAYF